MPDVGEVNEGVHGQGQTQVPAFPRHGRDVVTGNANAVQKRDGRNGDGEVKLSRRKLSALSYDECG